MNVENPSLSVNSAFPQANNAGLEIEFVSFENQLYCRQIKLIIWYKYILLHSFKQQWGWASSSHSTNYGPLSTNIHRQIINTW